MFLKKITLIVWVLIFNFGWVQTSHALSEIENPLPISNTCIGDSGKVEWLVYNNLKGVGLDMDVLYHHPSFPQSPDRVEYVYSLASQGRYNDFFGGMIRGYIKAPETGQYVFNITGDEKAVFQLSTDTLKSNLVEIAETLFPTGETNHDNAPSQTSDTIQLVAGDFYYFEAKYIDSYSGDFIRVHWKIPSEINSSTWNIVQGNYLFADTCQAICPSKGTSCDDGDINTINDMEDGACNCFGTPDSLAATCIGDRGVINALYYDTIPPNGLPALFNDADYPLSPNRAEILTSMMGPLSPGPVDQYGTRIRVFLQIPQTGYYQFNLTGDDQVSLWLSSTTNISSTDSIAFLPSGVNDYNHTFAASQTSDSLLLYADTIYSLEVNHAELYGGDDFFVFWKTPWAQDSTWRILDDIYLYSYECEMACIPEDTPCNDGDSNTFDDKYDANCNCIGTPCSDPACSNAQTYTPYEPCADTDQHSTYENDSWVSCELTPNPNPIRDTSHWLLYDFGEPYFLNSANIWNYNVMDSTGHGFNEVIIDYSIDGTTWIELDTFVWNQATGLSDYTGFTFSDFNGIAAQYVLFTALSSYDTSGCAGISEINFGAQYCVGVVCDDGDDNTFDDIYSDSCSCQGSFFACEAYDSIINIIPITSDTFRVEHEIFSEGEVKADSTVKFIAGYSITLLPGFVADSLSDFHALISPCDTTDSITNDTTTNNNSLIVNNNQNVLEEERLSISQNNNNEIVKNENFQEGELFLKIYPNPTTSWTSISFNLPHSTKVELEIINPAGKLIYKILNKVVMEEGNHIKKVPAQRLEAGVYFVVLKTDSGRLTKKLVVVSL